MAIQPNFSERDFSVVTETNGSVRVLRLSGELDVPTAPLVRVA